MAIERTKTLLHWNYFLALEEDLLTISRYVELSSVFDNNGKKFDNNLTFSSEIAKLFLNIGSEIDVVLKEICKKYGYSNNIENINQYRDIILRELPNFVKVKATIPRLGITNLNPWEKWSNSNNLKNPLWWKAYNKVKHDRSLYFQEANIKNCLNAIAALYICVLFLYQEEANLGNLPQLPKLFNIEDKYFRGTSIGRYGICFKYKL